MLDRIKAVNPLSWVLIIAGAVIGYGAGAIAKRLAPDDNKKQVNIKIALKVVGLVLAGAAVLVTMLAS